MRSGRGAWSLPVSGARFELRDATGEDELLVCGRDSSPAATIAALAARLARPLPVGASLEWGALPAVDLSAAALTIRSAWLGERIHTETLCPQQGCGEPIDVALDVSEYLEHHRPRPYRAVQPDPGGSWLGLEGSEVRFRIPTVADVLAAEGADAVASRCILPWPAPAGVARRVDRALDAIAPRLDDYVNGRCPMCGAEVELFFDPLSYVLAELTDACSGLFADVHELAFSYHWSEREILALDRRRRHGYVAMVRGELALA